MADTATMTAMPAGAAEADEPGRRPVVTLLPGGHPGIIIDRFGAGLVVQANAAGIERLMPVILDALHQVLMPEAIVLRNDTPARALEGLPAETRVVAGQVDGPVPLEENGAVYEADVLTGQKTGWFFDQRDNLGFIAGLAGGARVLGLYRYRG